MVRRKLNITRGDNNSVTFEKSETDTTKDLKYGMIQFVSEPVEAITWSHNDVSAAVRHMESDAGANYKMSIVLAYCDEDGSNVTYIADGGCEGENDFTALTEIPYYINTMASAADVPSGKRLIVELGFRTLNTKSTEYFCYENITDNHATTDLAIEGYETAAYNSWVEFFETITEATASVNKTPGSGSATIGGVQPVQGLGIFVPTEVDV